jgi:uncharacterized protein (DUF2249 family)
MQYKKNKMKKIRFIFGFIALSLMSHAQSFQWAKKVGGSNKEDGNSIAVDASGNVYTTGTFQGTVDFDPSVGTYTLASNAVYGVYLLKLDALGNFVWAQRIAGLGSNAPLPALTLDASGNVFVTGGASFSTSTYTCPYIGGVDVFVAKFNSAGSLTWAKSMGGQYDDYSTSIKVDPLGNVLTTGYYSYVADFDPGPLSYTLGIAQTNSAGIFTSKLDGSGNFVWAKGIANYSNSNQSYGLDVDASGNVYTTGLFFNTLDFDPNPSTYTLTSFGTYDIFVSKIDAAGNFLWAKQMGGSSGEQGNAIVVDGAGNVYTTGGYQGTVDFDPGVGTYTLNVGSTGTFLSKLDAMGNFVWAKKFTGGNDSGAGLAIDGLANVYITGSFISTMYFSSLSSGLITLTSNGSQDVFILKIDSASHLINAKSFGSNAGDYGNAIAIDASNNVYTTGSFQSTADFDPDATTYTLSASFVDAFISKLSISNATSINDYKTTKSMFNIYPNPTNSILNLKLLLFNNEAITIEFTDVLGQVVLSKTITENNTQLNLSTFEKGIYFVTLTSENKTATKKLIIN